MDTSNAIYAVYHDLHKTANIPRSSSHPLKEFVRAQLVEFDRVLVLIPVLEPHRLRHRLLHNQLNLVLSAAFVDDERVVVARVVLPVDDIRH